jgi:hypothetical protein
MDLQNYPRFRKSNRTQPEALDSKTSSTFPVMAGSSFWRMSDEQVLPLQYFNIFFVLKGLIERPAQHNLSAAGPRHWHWYCQTQSYLHFEHCIWMTSIEPTGSRLWETRVDYREIPIQIRAMDVMAGGGRGAGPAQSIRHQEPGTQARICTIIIKTQTFHQLDILYVVSVPLQCSGNACEQYAEDLGFETCLHLFEP